eukprot:TRINITY_DN2068_c0_g1_i1.p1 TRINITY_DN2068_c0_g1~~TRINITY_DN2068_c0_g1_i1.p1  ORF type:complete len:506 (+),score=192.49 TRINITY_DN2068_c0_g1_i1:54-1520(+)
MGWPARSLALAALLLAGARASSIEAVLFSDAGCQRPLGRISMRADGACACAQCARPPELLPPLGGPATPVTATRPDLAPEESPADRDSDDPRGTPTPTRTSAATATATYSPAATATSALTATLPTRGSSTATRTATRVRTGTVTATVTLPSQTVSVTASLRTASATATPSAAATATLTATATRTRRPAPAPTRTATPTAANRPSATRVPTMTAVPTPAPGPGTASPTQPPPSSDVLPRSEDLMQPLRHLGAGVQCVQCAWPSYVLAEPPGSVTSTPRIAAGHAECTSASSVKLRFTDDASTCSPAPSSAVEISFTPFRCVDLSPLQVTGASALFAVFGPTSCGAGGGDDDGLTGTETAAIAMAAAGALLLVGAALTAVVVRRRVGQLQDLPRAIDAANASEQELAQHVDSVRQRGIELGDRIAKQQLGIEHAVGGSVGAATVGQPGGLSALPAGGAPLRDEFGHLATQMAQVEADLSLQKRILRGAVL